MGMNRNLFCCFAIAWLPLFAKEIAARQPCEPVMRTEEPIAIRHIETKGVGYNVGYTTLECFLIPKKEWINAYLPFIDARFHIFDNGTPAVNAGLGFRYLSSRIWGAYGYYDYRRTRHYHYNQISLGFESLGALLDFRVNGYLPVGNKRSHYYDTHFDSFQGHELILIRKKEMAMKGINAEMGVHFTPVKKGNLYGAFGPYYFENAGKHAVGGEARLAFTFLNHVRVEAKASYDSVFKGILQGQIGFYFGFGKEKEAPQPRKCPNEMRERAYQYVDRQEIIPVVKKHYKTPAIDPATGQPYFFIFVDNTSSSNGTFESPYPSLSLAETHSSANDVVYVFPGNGTSTGMNTGFRMKTAQKLLGAANAYNLNTEQGMIQIPALASTKPAISNTLIGAEEVVLLNSGNQVSGFLMTTPTNKSGIACVNSTVGYEITENEITLVADNFYQTVKGVSGTISGNILIANNIFKGADGLNYTYGVYLDKPSNGNVTIANNHFTGTNETTGLCTGIFVNSNSYFGGRAAATTYLIADNTFDSVANTAVYDRAIFIHNNNGLATITAVLEGNKVTVPSTISNAQAGIAIIEGAQAWATLMSVSLRNNSSYTVNPIPGYLFRNDNANPSLLMIQFSGGGNNGTAVFE